jgi:hypothetical protein
VRIYNPQSLAAAMSLARQLELQEQYSPAPVKAASLGLLPPPPARLAISAPPTDKTTTTPITGEGQQVKHLSWPEQEERRHLGLCFNCNEKYTRGHNRVCRRIFYIDGFEITDDTTAADEPDTTVPVFSLHAVAGVAANNTIQLQVLLGATSFIALVDSGSTQSFIGEEAARRSGLHIEPRSRFTAMVANGERVSCPSVICQAPVVVDDAEFRVDLYVMPLAGYDVVLGAHWMATLGTITWDFASRTMAFQQEGCTICCRGTAVYTRSTCGRSNQLPPRRTT